MLVLGVTPALLVPACAAAGRALAGPSARGLPVRQIITRLSPALVPLGFSMWLAHFGFHLWTGIATLLPAAERAGSELGLTTSVAVSHAMAPSALAANLFPELELWLLAAGLVVSVAVGWRLARDLVERPGGALRLALPWAALAAGLYMAGVWIVLQPMQMRGMVM